MENQTIIQNTEVIDNQNNEKEIYVKPIDSLCFIGGGARGYVYPGTYKALCEAGIMDNVNLISGASAGALTSCFIACGMTHDDFYTTLSRQNFKDLLGKGNFLRVKKDGQPLQDLLFSSISEEFQKTLSDEEISLEALSEDEQNTFEALKNQKADYQFTMADLALLRKINPKKYKDLLVTAVHTNNANLHIFSSVEQTDLIKGWLNEKKEFNQLIDRFENINYQLKPADWQLIEQFIDSDNINNKQKKQLRVIIKELESINDGINEKSINNNDAIITKFNLQIKKIFLDDQNLSNTSPDLKTLIDESQDLNYQFKQEDLDLIKRIDPTKDFVLRLNKDGKNEIFSNISIVSACMASAALPLVLQNVEINGQKFMDGGVLENIPLNMLNREDNTLVLGFNEESLYKTLYTDNKKPFKNGRISGIIEFVLKVMGFLANVSIEKSANKSYNKVRKHAYYSTVLNDIKDIGVTDFTTITKLKVEGLLRGYFSTMNHLILYNTHPKAKAIIQEQLQLADLQKELNSVQEIDEDKNQKAQELANKIQELEDEFDAFSKRFELRKFIFEVIDNTKDRKSKFYEDLLNFCNDDQKFQGHIEEIVNECFNKFEKHNKLNILQEALDKRSLSSNASVIPSEQIRDVFANNNKALWTQAIVERQENITRQL